MRQPLLSGDPDEMVSLGRVYNQAGYGFAEATAAKWPEIVTRQAAKMGGK